MAFEDTNGAIVKRLFATDVAPRPRIEVDSYRSEGVNSGGQIRFYKGTEAGFQAARIEYTTDGLDPEYESVLHLQSSTLNGGFPSSVLLYEKTDGTTEIAFSADAVSLGGGLTVRDSGLRTMNRIWALDPNNPSIDETWHNCPLVNSWAAISGLTCRYRLSATGEVTVIGRIAGGTAGLVMTLPTPYRPSQLTDISLKSNNDASTHSWTQINSSGAVTVVSNVAAAQTWLAFNFSFHL